MSNQLLDTVLKLQKAQSEYNTAKNQLNTYKDEAYDIIKDIAADAYKAWSSVEPKLAECINNIAKKYNFEFSNEDYADNNLDEIIWRIGNNFPIYNESCQLISDYPLESANLDSLETSVQKDNTIFVECVFHGMDGFNMTLPITFLDKYLSAGENNEQVFVDYMNASLRDVHLPEFEKRCKDAIPVKKETSSSKEERLKRLAAEAEELGLTLVEKKK